MGRLEVRGVPEELSRRLRRLATERGQSVSQVVVELLQGATEQLDPPRSRRAVRRCHPGDAEALRALLARIEAAPPPAREPRGPEETAAGLVRQAREDLS